MHLRSKLCVSLLAATLAGAADAGAMPRLIRGSADPSPTGMVVGEEGARWSLPGGPTVRAKPGAVLRVLHQPQEVQILPGRTRPVYTVIVNSGGVDVEVPRGAASAVALATPRRLTVLVRSGRAGVRASPEGLALANFDGDILVGHDARHFKAVARGVVRRFTPHGVEEAPLLQPPSALGGQRVLMSTGAPVALERLWWQARQGARRYRVELSRRGEREPLFAVETSEPALPRTPVGLAPGAYRVSVRAVDELGFESVRALETSLHVIAAKLPAGAYFDGAGSIRVAPGSEVTLSNTEGLNVSYSKLRHEQVLGAVKPQGGEPVMVFLRAEGDDEPLPLKIAPRTVRARIHLTPARVRWPAQPLTVRVELEDPSGQAVPDWLEMRVRVRLGIDDLPIDFERRGRGLVGVVPPRASGGPWVVRVDVEDQFGVPLGHDFIEIARSAKP